MAVTNYYSVNGRLLGEATNGVETTYMTDALGSTIGTVTNAGLRNRYVYKPYGGLLGGPRVYPDPRFLWNGRSGYRTTGRNYAEEYIRRRHFSPSSTQWCTVDTLWPSQTPYGYALGNPTSWADPFGLEPICDTKPTKEFHNACVFLLCSALFTYELAHGFGEAKEAIGKLQEGVEITKSCKTLNDTAKNARKSPYCECLENAMKGSGDYKERIIHFTCFQLKDNKNCNCGGAPNYLLCYMCCMETCSGSVAKCGCLDTCSNNQYDNGKDCKHWNNLCQAAHGFCYEGKPWPV